MGRKGAWTDSLLGDACKCWLKSGDKLCFQLALDLLSVILLLEVSANIGIEEKRVCNAIRINAAAAHGYINIQTDILIYHAEWNRIRCAEFIVHQFFGIEIINALVFACVTAVGKTFADGVEGIHNGIAQIAGKNAGLCGCIVGIFARLCADIHDLALFYDHHALSVCNCDSGAAGDDIVVSSGVGGAFGGAFLAFHCQNVIVDGIAVEKLFPLICKCTACCSKSCFNKSHNSNPFLF